MLLFALIFQVAELLIWLIVVYQFLQRLLSGESNARVARFSHALNWYVYGILRYLTFETEEKPFPFRDWEGSPPKP